MQEPLSSPPKLALGLLLFVLLLSDRNSCVSSSAVQFSDDEPERDPFYGLNEKPTTHQFIPPISFTQYNDPHCSKNAIYRGYIASITALEHGSFCIRSDPLSSISSRVDIVRCEADKIYEDWYTCIDSACSECHPTYKAHTGWGSVRPQRLMGHCFDYDYAQPLDVNFLDAFKVRYSFDLTNFPLNTFMYTKMMDDNSCIREGQPTMHFEPPIPFTQHSSGDCAEDSALQSGAILSIKQMGRNYGSYCTATKLGDDIQYTRTDVVGCKADGIYKEFYSCADDNCLVDCTPMSKARTGWDGVDPNPTVGFCYDSVHTPLDDGGDNTTSTDRGFSFAAAANPDDARTYLRLANGNSCIEEGQPTHPNTVEVTTVSCEAMAHSHRWTGSCCSLAATTDGGCALVVSSGNYCTVHGPIWNKDYKPDYKFSDLEECPPSEFETHELPSTELADLGSEYNGWFRFYEGTAKARPREAGQAPPGSEAALRGRSQLPECTFEDQAVVFNPGFTSIKETLVVDGCLLDCQGNILRGEAGMSAVVDIRNGGHVRNCSVALHMEDEWFPEEKATASPFLLDGEGRFLDDDATMVPGSINDEEMYVSATDDPLKPPGSEDDGFGTDDGRFADDDGGSFVYEGVDDGFQAEKWDGFFDGLKSVEVPVSGFRCQQGDCLIEDSRCTAFVIDQAELPFALPILRECVLVGTGAGSVRITGGLVDFDRPISKNGIVAKASPDTETKAKLVVEGLTITHQLGNGIYLMGGASSVRISDVYIGHNQGDAILVEDGDDALTFFAVIHAALTDNERTGLEFSEPRFYGGTRQPIKMLLSDLFLGYNRRGGLHVDRPYLDLAIDESIFDRNGLFGIEIENAGTVAIQGVRCRQNGNSGAFIGADGAIVDIRNSLFTYNKLDGIALYDVQNATITNVVANMNQWRGIHTKDVSKLNVYGIDAMKNTYGITINRFGHYKTANTTNQMHIDFSDVRTCKNGALGLEFDIKNAVVGFRPEDGVVSCKNDWSAYREVVKANGTLAVEDAGFRLWGNRCEGSYESSLSCKNIDPLLNPCAKHQCKGHRIVVTTGGTVLKDYMNQRA